MSVRHFFLTALLFFSEQSWADILYIDANDTKNEIGIFQEYADCLGEKLVVLPKDAERGMYLQRGRAIEQKKAEKEKIEKALAEKCGCDLKDGWRDMVCPKTVQSGIDQITAYAAKETTVAPIASRCTSFYFEWSRVFNEVNTTMPSRYHAADLRKDLVELMSSPESKIESVVISGHHYLSDSNYDGKFAPGAFQGLTSWLKDEDLAKAFEGLPGNRNVQSLFLLGCKPLYIKKSQENWQQAFPNADFIGGYSVKGYLSSDPKGNQFVRDILGVHQDTLAKIRENLGEPQLVQGLDAIMKSGISVPGSSFSVCTRAKGKDITYKFQAASTLKPKPSGNSKRPICKRPNS